MRVEGNLRVPLVDLSYQHRVIAQELDREWQEIIAASSYVGGSVVTRFEQAFAEFCGIAHCVGVANGTDAVELCVRAAGIGPGADVLVPANSFVATAFAVMRAGARPVLMDVDEQSLLVDPSETTKAMTSATKAVIPVHLFGQLAPMELIEEAVGPDVVVIEDAAQAQGATRGARAAGSFGLAAAMSFYPSKNLGAYGDAGAVLTRSGEFAGRIRALRNHGGESKNLHAQIGFNSRLDPIQAAVLLVKLQHLVEWNEERRTAASHYHELLEGHPQIKRVSVLDGNEHVWYVYVVRIANRDAVLVRLTQAGIGAAVHYPMPIHLQEPFREMGYGEGDFPRAEAAAKEILSLPLYPGITKDQQQRVIAELIGAMD